jgi:hypothetical protein
MVSGLESGFKKTAQLANTSHNSLVADAPDGRPCSKYRLRVTAIS